MSFSGYLRAETARLIPPGKRDIDTAIASLIANLCTCSAAEDGSILLHFSAGNPAALRKCFTLIQKNVNISSGFPASWMSFTEMKTEAQTEGAGTPANTEKAVPPDLLLDASEQMTDLLRRLRFLNRDGTLRIQDGTLEPELVGGKRSRAYLREMFLCTGFMNDPVRRYHLEYRCFA